MAFSQEVFDEICEQIADGKSLREICSAEDMPAKSTVMQWLADDAKDEEGGYLVAQYEQAREEQADALADECLHIADTAGKSKVEIQHAKLRIDTRKWTAGKLRPKKYGEKTQMELGGEGGGAIKHKHKFEFVVTRPER